MRNAALVLAGLLGIVGVIWVGQGLGYIPGSFMTGDPRWFRAGLACLIVAAVLAFTARRRRRA